MLLVLTKSVNIIQLRHHFHYVSKNKLMLNSSNILLNLVPILIKNIIITHHYFHYVNKKKLMMNMIPFKVRCQQKEIIIAIKFIKLI